MILWRFLPPNMEFFFFGRQSFIRKDNWIYSTTQWHCCTDKFPARCMTNQENLYGLKSSAGHNYQKKTKKRRKDIKSSHRINEKHSVG